MDDKLLQTQKILNLCFHNASLRVGLNTTQDYFNAVFDPSGNFLRVAIEGAEGVLYWSAPVATVAELPATALEGTVTLVLDSGSGSAGIFYYESATWHEFLSGLWTQVVGGIVSPSSGVITAGTTSYEDLVIADNDIPNKKYVDSAITGGIWHTQECLTSPGGTTTNILIGSMSLNSACSIWLIFKEGSIRRDYKYSVLSDGTTLVGSQHGAFLETAPFPATISLGQVVDGDGERMWLTITLTEAGIENSVMATYQIFTAPTDGYFFLIHGGDVIPEEVF